MSQSKTQATHRKSTAKRATPIEVAEEQASMGMQCDPKILTALPKTVVSG